MQPWKTLSRKTIFEQRPWLVVEHHTMMPNRRVRGLCFASFVIVIYPF
jgi:hypothetical protein